MCMLAFRQDNPEGQYIIIVPTTALLDQWYVSLIEDLGVAESEMACFSAEEMPNSRKVVNLLVINTARQIAPQLAAPGNSFMIVDECHRAGSLMNAMSLHGIHRATLGLSATPEREYDEGFEEHIIPALGQIIYRYDYKQAYADGIVSPFQLINVKVDMLPDEEAEYLQLTKWAAKEAARLEREGGPDDRLKRILMQRAGVSARATMRIPVAAALVEQNRGKRTLVFHERIEAADSLLTILRSRKHNATVYHSKLGPVLRRDNLRLYRKGMFDVLVTCRALDEGTNVPETTVAVMASSTASQRQRIQRLGRVLRPAEGKKMATVFTIYASKQEENRLKNEAEELEGVASVTWTRGGRRSDG